MYFDGSRLVEEEQACSSSLQMANNSNTFSKFSSKYPTTKQNMKPSYMAFDWPYPSASSDYSPTETPSL